MKYWTLLNVLILAFHWYLIVITINTYEHNQYIKDQLERELSAASSTANILLQEQQKWIDENAPLFE